MKKFGTGASAVEISLVEIPLKETDKNIYAVREIGGEMKHFAGYYTAKSYEDAHLAYIREPFGQSETEMEKE